jgi:putative spermidine/putrescine transport system substrate-binding protein
MKTNQQGYDSNLSRRQLLRVLGATGVTTMSLGACRRKSADATAVLQRLQFYGTGTLNIEDWSVLNNTLRLDIKFQDNGNDTGPVLTQMIAGTAAQDYDIGGLQGGAERELAAAGVILPWDLKKIPNWSAMWPWARDIPYAKVENRQYGLPVVINADSMIYLPDKVGVVDSYAAVFDPKLRGKTSMEDAWINSAIFTAIYLKQNGLAKIQNPGDLTPSELEEVMGFLIRKKREGQFRKFWNGWEDGLQLITSGEVYVMTGWEPIVYAARKKNINAKYAVPKEGYEGWSNDLLLHAGAQARQLVDAAHEFANWELGGYYGCRLSKLRGYVVPTDRALEYARDNPTQFDTKEIEQTAHHVQSKFLNMGGQVFWQNVRPQHYKLYDDWWSRLRSA